MSDRPFNLDDLSDRGLEIRQRIRELFAPSMLLAGLRTLVWLAPLTITIWYYAERSTRKLENQRVQVSVRTADPTRIARLVSDDDRLLDLSFAGPASATERARTELSRLELVIDDTSTTGVQNRSAKELIEKTSAWKSSRLTLESVRPNTIAIEIDELIERSIPVKSPDELNGILVDTGTIFDPPVVTIRAPKREIESAAADGRLFAEAIIGDLPILKTPGKKDPIVVSIRSPLPEPATIAPRTVAATLEVKSSDKSLTLESVSVFANIPPFILNDFRVTVVPPTIPNVRVIGPEAIINALAQNQIKPPPVARIDFAEEDRQAIGRPISKRVTVMLPDGVRVDPSVGPLTVEMTIERRDGGN